VPTQKGIRKFAPVILALFTFPFRRDLDFDDLRFVFHRVRLPRREYKVARRTSLQQEPENNILRLRMCLKIKVHLKGTSLAPLGCGVTDKNERALGGGAVRDTVLRVVTLHKQLDGTFNGAKACELF
jgi:hypothetical protein